MKLKLLLKTSRADRVWLCLFGLWFILLSGALAPLSQWTAGPGWIQWYKISRLARHKRAKMAEIEARIIELSAEQVKLEKSPVAQRREIRRVLGYLAPDEIAFDFSSDPVQPSLARH